MKKAQSEILGLLIIVLLLSFSIITFLIIFSNNNNQEFSFEEKKADLLFSENFLVSFLTATVPGFNFNFNKLINFCVLKKKLNKDGVLINSCELLEKDIQEILKRSHKNIELSIFFYGGSPILKVSNKDCNFVSNSYKQTLPLENNHVAELIVKICK